MRGMDSRWAKLLWGTDVRVTGIRLAAEIALAPLPVFMWIQSHGWYSWSPRHPAEPLHSCFQEALICTLVCGAVGLMLSVLCARSVSERLGVVFMISAETFLVWTYLDVNAVAYA
jgi:hypothetical protein